MMKKWIALLLMAALLLCSVSALANTEVNWADVEENAYEIDPNGEFWTLSDLGLQMWIPSVFEQWDLTDEQAEKGYQFVFATSDDAAEVWCKYVAYDGSLEDIIGSVKKGVYVDQFANGEVKIGEGDFTFYVKSGSLIENGRLTMPVKDINIIANGPQALADVLAVATDLKIDNSTWTCGKEQSVPVSCGMPSVLVKGLTVGGD